MSPVRQPRGARYYQRNELPLSPDVTGARSWGVALDHSLLTYFEVDAHCSFPMHQHESEQITLVLEGALYFLIDGVEHCVGEGDVIAIPSDLPHAAFTRDRAVRAVDAWSPVLPAYQRVVGTIEPAHASSIGVENEE